MSRFFKRTISVIQDKKTKNKEDQLTNGLHNSLMDEKQTLIKLTKTSDYVRKDSKVAEKIRKALKTWKEHLSDMEQKLNDLGSKIKQFTTSWAKRHEIDETKTSGNFDALSFRSRASFVSFVSFKEGLKQELTRSDGVEVGFSNLTERLLDLMAEVHEAFGDKCFAMEHHVQQSLVNRWSDYVKGDVRDARYNGHEFFKLYAEYQQALQYYNQVVVKADSEGIKHAESKKKIANARKSVEASGKHVLECANNCDKSFQRCEVEWDCGHVPFGLIIYLKTFKKSIQELNSKVNEILSDEVIQLMEKTLSKRYELRKVVTARYDTRLENYVDENSGWEDSSIHGVRPGSSLLDGLRISNFFDASCVSAPPSPTSVAVDSSRTSELGELLTFMKLDEAPLVAPPPPSPIAKEKSIQEVADEKPLPEIVVEKQYYTDVIWPSVGQTFVDFIKNMLHPDLNFWTTICKNEKFYDNESLHLPMILPASNIEKTDIYNAIKSGLKIINEASLIPCWLETLLEVHGDKTILEDLANYKCGVYVPWNEKPGPSVVEVNPSVICSVLQVHIFWYLFRHFVDRTIKEICFAIESADSKSLKEQEKSKKKTFRLLLGQKTFFNCQARSSLIGIVNQVCREGEALSLKKAQLLTLVIFEYVTFPVWEFFAKGLHKVEGVDTSTVDFVSFRNWMSEFMCQIRLYANEEIDTEQEYFPFLKEFFDNVCQQRQSYVKSEADLWMLREMLSSFENSYC